MGSSFSFKMRTGPLIFSLLLVFCNAENTPTVLWHAMGDSCCNPITMGYFIDTIKSETNAYVLSLQIGDNAIDDTLNGFFLDTNVQIEMVCKQIAEDPELQNGYNAIGLSQGGQFLRAVAQRCPNPPMKNLVTIGSQHQGVFGLPGCPGESSALCNIFRELLHLGVYEDSVQSSWVQAQYWHDPIHLDEYVEKSQFIAEINNEKEVKNETYAENLKKLENFVMAKFVNDTVVEPRESSHFEFYVPGQDKEILPLRESQLYLEDWIGLKALDESGRLHFLEHPGDHVQVYPQWLIDNIIHKFFM